MVRVGFSACLPLIKVAKPLGSRERDQAATSYARGAGLDVGVAVTRRHLRWQIDGEGITWPIINK
jgi:hypothetical protein